MSKDIYALAFELKDLLDNDPRIKILNDVEEDMKSNQEVKDLVFRKEIASILYESGLNNYGENSEEFKDSLKLLHKAKLDLDTHPLVRTYLDDYSVVRDLYFQINDILFSGLNLNMKECK